MELNNCINFLLTTAQHNVFQYLSQQLAPYGVTPSQYGVLNCLWKEDGYLTPKQIADTLCLETSTISGVLDRMQKKGLIDRNINLEDRREVQVTITETGRALEEPVLKVIEDVNARAMKIFSDAESESFKENLRRIGEESF
ncbi:MAG: MarR family transcriptional regulator [Eubacterium sp.]|nr:MarR family transcriptional regulator [Eubacterium sp.]